MALDFAAGCLGGKYSSGTKKNCFSQNLRLIKSIYGVTSRKQFLSNFAKMNSKQFKKNHKLV